jgi:hypothetical protein
MQRLPADLALDWIPQRDFPDDALTAFPEPTLEARADPSPPDASYISD